MGQNLTPPRQGRIRRVTTVAAAATAIVAGTLTSSPAAHAAVTPAAMTFHGFEMVFVASDGHLRNVDPDGSIHNHGPILARSGSTASVDILGLPNGSFQEMFRASDRMLWMGNNGGFHLYTSDGGETNPTGLNTTPAMAADTNGHIAVNFAQGGDDVQESAGGFGVSRNSIADNTSPALAAVPGSPGGFISTWVDQDAHLNWADANNLHIITNFTVQAGTSPTIAAFGGHWKIDVQASSGLEWEVFDTGQVNQTTSTIVGSPSDCTLSTGLFKQAYVGGNGHLYVENQDTGRQVEHGSNPAIAANGGGGWRVIFEGTNLHPETLDSSGNVTDIPFVISDGTSPAITALFTT